ncbi:MAG: SMP-30/gluconolactonase/LRE family protein [Cyclobacteriaceae bacterium]|nr:SMP-30/gluconolactonase/LRE family protein [Cyclobacteriaceae bacterium]
MKIQRNSEKIHSSVLKGGNKILLPFKRNFIYFILHLFVFFYLLSCGKTQNKDASSDDFDLSTQSENEIAPRIMWSLDENILTPESIPYFPDSGYLFVSNIAGNSREKNQSGYISVVNLEGVMVHERWTENLNAPKGMAIFGDRLYVADIDKLVETDLRNGNVIKNYTVEGASFMNDVTADAMGRIFVSDSDTGCIYMLDQGQLTRWLCDDDFERPNGLCIDNGLLWVVFSGSGNMMKVNVETKQAELFTTGLEVADGIVPDGKGGWVVSSWAGQAFHVSEQSEVKLFLDTRELNQNCADIAYIPEKGLLLVPTFNDNRIIAYSVKF